MFVCAKSVCQNVAVKAIVPLKNVTSLANRPIRTDNEKTAKSKACVDAIFVRSFELSKQKTLVGVARGPPDLDVVLFVVLVRALRGRPVPRVFLRLIAP